MFARAETGIVENGEKGDDEKGKKKVVGVVYSKPSVSLPVSDIVRCIEYRNYEEDGEMEEVKVGFENEKSIKSVNLKQGKQLERMIEMKFQEKQKTRDLLLNLEK